MNELDPIFKPRSIAVVGASRTPGAIGHTVVKNILDSGYRGKVYPVNPKADEILGLKCYKSVLDIPDEVDLAVITVPARICPAVIEECGKKGVKGAAVIASGFSEVGKEGAELERKIVEIARSYGMRILGPNIVGIMNNPLKCNASFGPYLPYPGKIAMISQSGALVIAMDARTYVDKVGMSHLISIGNMADLDFSDLIEYFAGDEDTTCISLYVEGIKDGRKFIETCRKVISTRPIVALKAGISERGAVAAASHTGSLAGSAKIYRAAFRQAGVVWAYNLNDLFNRSLALSLQPPMRGDNLLVITNGGGVGVLATDAAERYGVPLKDAPEELKAEMRKAMPEFGSPKNPVDLTGMAGAEWYRSSVEAALRHEWVDGLVVLYCETAMTDPVEIAKAIYEAKQAAGVNKPVTVSFVGGEAALKGGEWLQTHGIPFYRSPDEAVSAMGALREYGRYVETLREGAFTPFTDVDRERVREILEGARADGRKALLEPEAKEVFRAYGIRVPPGRMATTEDEAVRIAEEVGYPVVLKIVSPQIIHKSDAGGVKVDIRSADEVREKFREIMENARRYDPNADLKGVYVQHMAPWGTETIIGTVRDPQFGPTIMFGLGGIFVEVLKDVTFRVAPVSPDEALEMTAEINGADILRGARGEKPKDVKAIAETIARLSQLVTDFPEIRECDANPVIVYEDGLSVVDARIILS